MEQFLSGATAMGYMIAALFFLRFFRQTGDRLFALFAVAFLILGLNRVTMAMLRAPDEVQPLYYVVRLVAFIIILIAIIDKNRGRSRDERRSEGTPAR